MPENQEDNESTDSECKHSKILDFFKNSVKDAKKEKVKPLSKILVRRLPPKMSKDDFLKEFSLPKYEYFYYVRGDLSLGNHAFSRAYINFENADDIFTFKEKFDDFTTHDELGKEYHAVVEWAPVQRVPKKNNLKRKAMKSGTLESDAKYLEFIAKIEEEKSLPANTSEYFLETENTTQKGTKITTTPLLEFIKMKRQKKIDLRNENRQRKREAEKERRRKEDEVKRADKLRKTKEDKEKKASNKEGKTSEIAIDISSSDDKIKVNDTSVDSLEQDKGDLKTGSEKSERKNIRKDEKTEKKDRGKVLDDANPSSKRERPLDSDGFEKNKTKKALFDEKSGRSSQAVRKTNTDSRINEMQRGIGPKSKYRYSEQRTREREVRSQKLEALKEKGDTSEKSMEDSRKDERISKSSEVAGNNESEAGDDDDDSNAAGEDASHAVHDSEKSARDPRTERRIRNKDRPSIEIYRPGMGKFSKQKLEQKKYDV